MNNTGKVQNKVAAVQEKATSGKGKAPVEPAADGKGKAAAAAAGTGTTCKGAATGGKCKAAESSDYPGDAKLAECISLLLDQPHVDRVMAAVLSSDPVQDFTPIKESEINFATATGACQATLAFMLRTRRHLFTGTLLVIVLQLHRIFILWLQLTCNLLHYINTDFLCYLCTSQRKWRNTWRA